VLSLSSLAGWEEAVLASIQAATGSPEERYRQIERSGMYGEYPAILNAYIELFADEDSALEALKRAVFLVWRSAMFSPDATGIAALPDVTARVVLERLDTAIRSDLVDDELAWMLAWYRDTGEFALELLGATPRALRWEADRGAEAWRDAGITADSMHRRGQLGMYWSALARGSS
jgi:hypothetical protein